MIIPSKEDLQSYVRAYSLPADVLLSAIPLVDDTTGIKYVKEVENG